MTEKQLTDVELLPDGTPFAAWERPLGFTRTYHVRGDDPAASDGNPGTEDAPFATISRAAEVLEPGERVVIGPGVYREHVRPARGGCGPEQMISYEAAPGAEVVIKGSEILEAEWTESTLWNTWEIPNADLPDPRPTVWAARLPGELFGGYNPFGMLNLPAHFTDNLKGRLGGRSERELRVHVLKRGLIYQDSRRLRQVPRFGELYFTDGTYWVEHNGLTMHVRPFGDSDPAGCTFEITTREQIFAPETRELGYLRVKGLTLEHAANGFPMPQRGALSVSHGHHWVIEDCTVRQANAVGIDIGHEDWHCRSLPEGGHHVIRGNTVSDCGICGICGFADPLNATLIEDNTVLRSGWHDIEWMFETAGMKFHVMYDCLLRRNVILGTTAAPGIWLDSHIRNTRITRNIIADCETMHGAILLEVSHTRPNLIDQNIVAGIRAARPDAGGPGGGGHGIYEHDTDRLIVAHNLIFDCDGAGVFLQLGQADRFCWILTEGRRFGRGSTARKHRVLNNAILDCGRYIEFANPDNRSDGNALSGHRDPGPLRIHRPRECLDPGAWRDFHGWDVAGAELPMTAALDRDTLALTWTVEGDLPAVEPVAGCEPDLFGRPRGGGKTIPGPFAEAPKGETTVDPRTKPEANHA